MGLFNKPADPAPEAAQTEATEPESTEPEAPQQDAAATDETAGMSRAERKKSAPKTARNRRIIIAVAATLGIVAVAAAVYTGLTYSNVSEELAPPPAEEKAIEQELDAPVVESPKEEPSYMLFLGNDRRPGQGWARSDTIMLARLDPNDGSVSMISIPRDTRVAIPGHGTQRIAHATALGGPALAIKTVKQLTGLPVNHYAQVDFRGFASIVDAVGGVKMTVDKATTSPEGVYVPAGKQVLNGSRALAFVRNRKGYARGDFQRMKNQQAFLFALARQASKPKNFTRLPKIIDSTSKNLQTDMSIGELMSLAGQYRGIEKKDMRAKSAPVSGRMIGGASYQILKEAEFKAMLADLEDGGFEPKVKEVTTEVDKEVKTEGRN